MLRTRAEPEPAPAPAAPVQHPDGNTAYHLLHKGRVADQDDEREEEDEDEEEEGRHRVENGCGKVAPEVPESKKRCEGEGDEDREVEHPLHDDDDDGVPDGEPGSREPVDPNRLAAHLPGGDRPGKEREELDGCEAPERHGVAETTAKDPDPRYPAEDRCGPEPESEEEGGDADLPEVSPCLGGEGHREKPHESRAADEERERDPAPAPHDRLSPHGMLVLCRTTGVDTAHHDYIFPRRGVRTPSRSIRPAGIGARPDRDSYG